MIVKMSINLRPLKGIETQIYKNRPLRKGLKTKLNEKRV